MRYCTCIQHICCMRPGRPRSGSFLFPLSCRNLLHLDLHLTEPDTRQSKHLAIAFPTKMELAERSRLSHRHDIFKSKYLKYNNYYMYCIDFSLLLAERGVGRTVRRRVSPNNHECRFHPFLSDIAT